MKRNQLITGQEIYNHRDREAQDAKAARSAAILLRFTPKLVSDPLDDRDIYSLEFYAPGDHRVGVVTFFAGTDRFEVTKSWASLFCDFHAEDFEAAARPMIYAMWSQAVNRSYRAAAAYQSEAAGITAHRMEAAA